jgi:hypothetical protein
MKNMDVTDEIFKNLLPQIIFNECFGLFTAPLMLSTFTAFTITKEFLKPFHFTTNGTERPVLKML